MFGLDPRAGLGARIAGANQRGIQTFGPQAADQAGRHVAGTDESDSIIAHDGSFERVCKAISGLAVVAGTKQRGTDPHPGGALGNGRFEIVAHAHGKCV